MKNQGFRYGEQGGVIVWIFVMIALLGVLTFAATRGNRGGMTNLDNEKISLSASEIISYAQGVREGVRALKIKGCADTQLSFAVGPTGGGYTNPAAPTDERCDAFKGAGAGLSYMPALSEWFDANQTSQTYYGQWFVTSDTHVKGVGSEGNGGPGCLDGTGACKELIIGLPYIYLNLCKAINRKLGFGLDSNGTPPHDTGNSFASSAATPFTGTYTTTGFEMGTATPAPETYTGKMAGCVESTSNPPAETYHFYQVLLAR